MLRHIVMFRLPETKTNEQVVMLKDSLDDLKNKIHQIRHLQTGINCSHSPNAYDIILETEFSNEKDLEIYRQHPDHLTVVTLLKELKCEISIVDYII